METLVLIVGLLAAFGWLPVLIAIERQDDRG